MSLQETRGIMITTGAGPDALLVYRMTVVERLSHSFEIELDLLSRDSNIALDSLLGTSSTVQVELPTGGKRYFNGLFKQFSWAGTHGNFSRYRATLVPWFWFLTRKADCRIFQNMTTVEIIEQVFRDNGFQDFKNSLTATYSEWEYCVQYRESDFDFASRLMEHEGIYYYYSHENGQHTLELCDSLSAHSAFEGYDTVPFFPPDAQRMRKREYVFDWSVSYEVQTGNYVLTDYDFENPKADLLTKFANEQKHKLSKFEIFDYPGEYSSKKAKDDYPVRRLQEEQVRFTIARGSANSLGMNPGSLFTLQGHLRNDQNSEHLLISSQLEFVNNEYESGTEEKEMKVHCDFEAIPSANHFRAARTTPQPRIRGPQTAVVVGKSEQEIWTDKYGRVKVQFHWDREGKMDENSSCWVRVSQSWAGKQWGTVHLPRIGQEVIVEFLEGDPDRPIITGRVYNNDMMPPYALPGNQTQSGIKTQSTTKANNQNFNELRFEDKKGEEHIYFHAEKDFERVVENNDTLRVGFDKKDSGDQVIEIFNDQKVVIGNDFAHTVSKGDSTLAIKAGQQKTKAAKAILLEVGGNSIKIDTQGITIKASKVAIEAQMKVDIKGTMVQAAGSATLTLKGGIAKIN